MKKSLSAREEAVVALIGQAKTDKEIANELGLSKRTVEIHGKNARLKLGLRNRVELALHAHGVHLNGKA